MQGQHATPMQVPDFQEKMQCHGKSGNISIKSQKYGHQSKFPRLSTHQMLIIHLSRNSKAQLERKTLKRTHARKWWRLGWERRRRCDEGGRGFERRVRVAGRSKLGSSQDPTLEVGPWGSARQAPYLARELGLDTPSVQL